MATQVQNAGGNINHGDSFDIDDSSKISQVVEELENDMLDYMQNGDFDSAKGVFHFQQLLSKYQAAYNMNSNMVKAVKDMLMQSLQNFK